MNETKQTGLKDIKLAQLVPNLTANVRFIVLSKDKSIPLTKDGRRLHTFEIADESAKMKMTVFGRDSNGPGDDIKPGHIYTLKQGFGRMYSDQLILYMGKGSSMYHVGEFCMLFREDPDISAPGRFK